MSGSSNKGKGNRDHVIGSSTYANVSASITHGDFVDEGVDPIFTVGWIGMAEAANQFMNRFGQAGRAPIPVQTELARQLAAARQDVADARARVAAAEARDALNAAKAKAMAKPAPADQQAPVPAAVPVA